MSLKSLLLSSLSSFNDLINDVDAPQYIYESEVPAASWIDELGRLRIWAGNVGAHQTGPSSLDFRLRDASHIQDEVTKLLKDLERLLEEAHEYIYEEDHEDESLCGSDSLDEDPVTELQALFGELTTIIQCLYKLAMLIRNPAQHDFLAESYRTETAAFEPWDQQHVRGKFPQAEEVLILRLARALTRRRGYLKYRERQSRKLAKGLEDPQTKSGGDGATISETMASDVQSQPVDYNDTPSESGISQTSYAESLLRGGVITLPAQPKDSTLGNPFVCPYCHFIITIKTTQSWPRHVFADLKPYICIFQPCRTPDKLYSSRREWFAHIRSTHDTTLCCPLCRLAVGTTQQYERHIARHLEELTLFVLPRDEDNGEEEQEEEEEKEEDAGTQRFSVTNSEARPDIVKKRTYPCDVCGEEFSEDDLSRHVAAHGGSNQFTPVFGKAEPLPSPGKGDDEARKTGRSGDTLQGELGDDTVESSDEDTPSLPQENLSAEEKKRTIRFIDCMGRKFTFPWHLCRTWAGMEDLIRHASQVESVRMEVKEGRYNLVEPDNTIVLPQAWESLVKPGWVVKMHLWRTPEDLEFTTAPNAGNPVTTVVDNQLSPIIQTSSPTRGPKDTGPDPFSRSLIGSELSTPKPPTSIAPLPVIHLAASAEQRLRDYGNIPRPRQEITGAPYQDRTQQSKSSKILNQAAHMVRSLVPKLVSVRKGYIKDNTKGLAELEDNFEPKGVFEGFKKRRLSEGSSHDSKNAAKLNVNEVPKIDGADPRDGPSNRSMSMEQIDIAELPGPEPLRPESPEPPAPIRSRPPFSFSWPRNDVRRIAAYDKYSDDDDPSGGNVASLSSPRHGEPYGSRTTRFAENFASDQGALSGEELEKQSGDEVLRSMMRTSGLPRDGHNDEEDEVEEKKEGSSTVTFSTTDSEARTEVLPGPEPLRIQPQAINEAVGNGSQSDVPPELIAQITQNVLNQIKASGIESSATSVPNPSKAKYPLPPPTLRCEECAAEFLDSDDLSRHIATHDGSNPPSQMFAEPDPFPLSEEEDDPIATAPTNMSKRRHTYWYCCQCNDGPVPIALVPKCINCGHPNCDSCPYP